MWWWGTDIELFRIAMKVTNDKVLMRSLSGHKYLTYDIALDYIPTDGLVYSFGLGGQIGFEEKLINNKKRTICGYDSMTDSEVYVKGLSIGNLLLLGMALTDFGGEKNYSIKCLLC